MEVADTIVVMAGGLVRQIGTPDQLYDSPADDFVMSFLGPVTRLDGQLVRPHDLELFPEPRPKTTQALVTRVTRLGFEVRVDLRAAEEEVWAQVTRGTAEQLGITEGRTLHLRRATSGAVERHWEDHAPSASSDLLGQLPRATRGHTGGIDSEFLH